MGLLRAGLPWWMQTGQPEPAQSMPQPAGVPAPAAGAPAPQAYQPRAQMQAPQGITQYAHQPLQGGQMPQLGAVPERQRMSFGDQLQETFEAPLFQRGLAFMAAGAPGGGGWGEAADRMSQISQQQQQRRMQERQMRREDTADKREETLFGRQQTVWDQQDQQRGLWETAVRNEQDPRRREMLMAMGPEAYGQWMAGEQQREFQAREGQLDRETTLAAAHMRANDDSLGRVFQRMDAERLATENETAARIQSIGLPALQNLRMTIEAAGASALPGQPIDARSRITLGRLFNGSSADRATLEVWRSQVLQPALEVMRGLGAMSEKEFAAAQEAFANPNMTYEGAMRLLNQRVQEAERRIAVSQASTQFFRENNNQITGVVNSQGEDYSTYLARQLGERGLMPSGTWGSNNPGPPGAQSGARPSAPTPPPAGGPPPAARRAGFTHWNGTMWTRPPRGAAQPRATPIDRNNPYGAY